MAWVAVGASLVSGAMKAYGQYEAGKEAKVTDEYNAQVFEQQAQEAKVAGILELYNLGRSAERMRASQEVAYARAGVEQTGSALDVMLETSTQFKIDETISKYNTAIAVRDLEAKAYLSRWGGQAQFEAAKVGAVSSFLGGVAQGTSKYYQYYGVN